MGFAEETERGRSAGGRKGNNQGDESASLNQHPANSNIKPASGLIVIHTNKKGHAGSSQSGVLEMSHMSAEKEKKTRKHWSDSAEKK